MIMYVVRHAESLPRDHVNYDEGRRIGLTRFGLLQAWFLARVLAKKSVCRLYSSTLERAKQTVQASRARVGVSVEESAYFDEFTPHPDLKGVHFKEAKMRARNDVDWKPSGGESVRESVQRFMKGVEVIAEDASSVAIVSHALIIQNVLLLQCGLKNVPVIDEVSVTTLSFDPVSKRLTVVRINERPLWLRFLSKISRVRTASVLWD